MQKLKNKLGIIELPGNKDNVGAIKTMSRNRSYRYLIKPDAAQKAMINSIIHDANFVKSLYIREEREGKKFEPLLKDVLYRYIRENPELQQSDISALLNALFQVTGRKRKENSDKIYHPMYVTSNYNGRIFVGDSIFLPKVGKVKMNYHRPLPPYSRVRSITITRNNIGEYHASVLLEFGQGEIRRQLDVRNSVGLDYSSPHLFVDDGGNRINIPHFYREKEKKLIKLIAAVKRCEKGSMNYYKRREVLNRTYRNIASRRNDYLHKLSTDLADKYDIICVEDLNMPSIAKKRNLAKATYDNSYGIFIRMLSYKMEDRGKKLVMIDKWFPSTKKCSSCGAINKTLKLDDRVWTCERCGSTHDRDINAAVNIRREGIRKYLNAVG